MVLLSWWKSLTRKEKVFLWEHYFRRLVWSFLISSIFCASWVQFIFEVVSFVTCSATSETKTSSLEKTSFSWHEILLPFGLKEINPISDFQVVNQSICKVQSQTLFILYFLMISEHFSFTTVFLDSLKSKCGRRRETFTVVQKEDGCIFITKNGLLFYSHEDDSLPSSSV
jgi:hypothetical protein